MRTTKRYHRKKISSSRKEKKRNISRNMRKRQNITRKIVGGGKLFSKDGKTAIKSEDLNDLSSFKKLDKCIVTQNNSPAYQIQIIDTETSQPSYIRENGQTKDDRSDKYVGKNELGFKQCFIEQTRKNKDDGTSEFIDIDDKTFEYEYGQKSKIPRQRPRYEGDLRLLPIPFSKGPIKRFKDVDHPENPEPIAVYDNPVPSDYNVYNYIKGSNDVEIYRTSHSSEECKTDNYRPDDPTYLSVTWIPQSSTINKYFSWGKSLITKNKSPLQEFKDAISFIYDYDTIPTNKKDGLKYSMYESKTGKALTFYLSNFDSKATITLTPGSVKIKTAKEEIIYLRNRIAKSRNYYNNYSYFPLRPAVFKQKVLDYYKTLTN